MANQLELIVDRLSIVGKVLENPTGSILFQSELNKDCKINASLGTTAINNKFLSLPSTTKFYNYPSHEIVKYIQGIGLKDLCLSYKERISIQNDLDKSLFGTPIITNGITHALSIVSMLFLDYDDEIIIHSEYWENYDIIFSKLRLSNFIKYSMFDKNNEFNIQALSEKLEKNKKSFLIFNFPNNPTGYSPTEEILEKIANELVLQAEKKKELIIVLIDEAGYGFFYEKNISKKSLFAYLIKKNSQYILPILAKGSTKEDLSYGLRVGSLTFGVNQNISTILEEKTAALIRGTLSSVCTSSQLALLSSINSKSRDKEFLEVFNIMEERYKLIKYKILPDIIKKGFLNNFYIYPFNSGFFLTLKTKHSASKLQNELRKNGIGITILGEHKIRVSFSSINKEYLQSLFNILLKTSEKMT